jgi:hypothetical protein
MSTSRRLRLALALLLAASLARNLKGNMLWNLAGPQAPADIAATYASPAADDASVEECLPPPEAYAFSYESIDRKVGGPNVICNATFTLKNLGQESLSAVVHIAWDNRVEQSQFWEVKPLGRGESWTEHVNESHLVQNAYLRVTHMLVVRDVPECWWLAANAERPRWEAIATLIDMLTCP